MRDRQTQKGRDSDHRRQEPGLRGTHKVTDKHRDHQGEKEISPDVRDSGDREHCPHREREMGLERE